MAEARCAQSHVDRFLRLHADGATLARSSRLPRAPGSSRSSAARATCCPPIRALLARVESRTPGGFLCARGHGARSGEPIC